MNGSANFECVVENAERLEWKVRLPNSPGEPVRLADNSTKKDIRLGLGIFETNIRKNGSTRHSSLVVQATKQNNMTGVQCLAIQNILNNFDSSDWATLTVFGVPDTPTELMADLSVPLSINISWTAPFSLPEVLLAYRISITSVNTGEGVIIDMQEETSYKFVPVSSACDFYEISVTALNAAGISDRAVLKSIPLPKRKI